MDVSQYLEIFIDETSEHIQSLKDCMEFSRILSLEQPEEDVKKENRQPVKHRTNGLKR